MTPEERRVFVDTARDVVENIMTPALVDQIVDESVARVASSVDVMGVVKAIARDTAEDAAREYVMHIIGATVKVKIARSWSPRRQKRKPNVVAQLPANTGPV